MKVNCKSYFIYPILWYIQLNHNWTWTQFYQLNISEVELWLVLCFTLGFFACWSTSIDHFLQLISPIIIIPFTPTWGVCIDLLRRWIQDVEEEGGKVSTIYTKIISDCAQSAATKNISKDTFDTFPGMITLKWPRIISFLLPTSLPHKFWYIWNTRLKQSITS